MREQTRTGLDRRTVLKASLLAGGGLALDALIPLPAALAGAIEEESGTRHSFRPSSPSHPMGLSRSCLRIRRSAKA